MPKCQTNDQNGHITFYALRLLTFTFISNSFFLDITSLDDIL